MIRHKATGTMMAMVNRPCPGPRCGRLVPTRIGRDPHTVFCSAKCREAWLARDAEARLTDTPMVDAVQSWLDGEGTGQIATELNEQGWKPRKRWQR